MQIYLNKMLISVDTYVNKVHMYTDEFLLTNLVAHLRVCLCVDACKRMRVCACTCVTSPSLPPSLLSPSLPLCLCVHVDIDPNRD